MSDQRPGGDEQPEEFLGEPRWPIALALSAFAKDDSKKAPEPQKKIDQAFVKGLVGEWDVTTDSKGPNGDMSGTGKAKLALSGMVGAEKKEFSYDVHFQEKTANEYAFVEHLWARRKVGYLLDQIRANGEKKELVEETKLLAKKYGIVTPYTSYLIMSEGAVPVVNAKPAKLVVQAPRPLILDRPGKPLL